MSQENVERVRRAYRLNQETQQPDYELLRRDVAWHTARDLPDSATYRGHDGVAELYSEWIGSFEDFRVEVEEIIDDGVWIGPTDHVACALAVKRAGSVLITDDESALPVRLMGRGAQRELP